MLKNYRGDVFMKQSFCIGNYSSKGIFCLNFEDGIFKPFSNFSNFPNCSYLIKNDNFLYHVVENNIGIINSCYMKNSSFFSLNHCSTHGSSPCHLAFDFIRNLLYVANYGDGSFSAFKVNSNR